MTRTATLLIVLTVAVTIGAIYAHADDAQDVRDALSGRMSVITRATSTKSCHAMRLTR